MPATFYPHSKLRYPIKPFTYPYRALLLALGRPELSDLDTSSMTLSRVEFFLNGLAADIPPSTDKTPVANKFIIPKVFNLNSI